ncbi:ribosomal protein S12 methylthiotransferase [Paenibacillus sp. E194]|jgi:ribosomal protein S12 methylthiotransferase|uniref:Ribosomal protein uS12 methylthiotransferase RimO n=4 Tax=Paenibacillus TaxID=44249 RepID=S9SDS4_PAEAL|nr:MULTISPECIES: 30S ribosomal protein S12 methylthiotransferase RimO [Paenibacillus]EPY04017.1 MiaB-like tRNA modifying protein YliG [Paenibacillus alvei TS-15]KJB85922.1 ribosomal protein S12 methylthiotransferase [Paenibacillus sp. E194]MCM3291648.1 30S ribosomal protein S12 methylthiotransferase RimO [Paenibacillus sp. MER 180]MDT8976680.1 30S ribosomal protein S12 methylthiotransferase RimO [Paenibacillus sp. chi10]TQR45862.1 30S ribosomal protein S12 methylthiotransferase RimO [Paenibaci
MTEKIKIVTLGCDKNLVDSEIMSGLIYERGYELVENEEEATVIIVNTCGFIDAAKEESVNTILRLADLKETADLKALIVSGCLTQRYKEQLLDEMPEIDGIVGTGDFDKINDIVDEALQGSRPIRVGNPVFDYDRILPRKVATPRYTAYVKIAEGCDNNCTFCSIPIMRGKFRSRTMESILAEVAQLAGQGVKEISLIAQDSTNYGVDLYDGFKLPELMNKVSEIPGVEWVRLHYAYPGFFTEELMDAIASNPKICKYIDMPLQHSEDSILKRMRRPGRQRDSRELVNKIRERIPGVALRTSIIVGFPGETDEDFDRLCDFIREMKFDRLGVFTYSSEEDTPATRLPDHVPDDVKEWRANTLMEIQRQVSKEVSEKRIGDILEVLVERYDGRNDVFIGRSQFDAPEIDGEVFISGQPLSIGEIAKVRITHALEFDLAGEGLA